MRGHHEDMASVPNAVSSCAPPLSIVALDLVSKFVASFLDGLISSLMTGLTQILGDQFEL